MLKGVFTVISVEDKKAIVDINGLQLDVNTKEKLVEGQEFDGVIFENIIRFSKDGKDKYFIARNLVASE